MRKFFNLFQLQNRLPAFSFFLSVGAMIVFFILLASPSDPKNAVIFGYSLERALLSIGLLIFTIVFFFLGWGLSHNPEKSQRSWHFIFQSTPASNIIFGMTVVLFLTLWVLLFLPAYRLGAFASYVSQLLPILVWIMVAFGSAIFIFLLEKNATSEKSSITEGNPVLKPGMIVFGILIGITLFINLTGIGIHYPQDYWYGAGVPVLGLQILFSLFIGTCVLLMENRIFIFKQKKIDVFVFIIIWMVSAWLWAREPISPNYFMPDTANNAIYPYSDGATFDTGAQYALIGQGLFNRLFFERILYSVFLFYLHIFLGQNVEAIMTVQAVIFAVLPAIVYLIGKEIHGRALGISAGVLIALRGVNAIIAAKWIDTASPKMVLTDFPTAIGVSIFLLLFIKWIKSPSKNNLLLWIGAVFALTFMVRSNVLTLLPAILLFVPFTMKLNWRQFILAGLLIVLGASIVTLPWELRNQVNGIPMYSMYYSRILTILRSRYGIEADAYIPPAGEELVEFSDNEITRKLARQRSTHLQSDALCESILCSISNHFLHNAVTSFVSLPTELVFDDIWNTVKADTPYWKKNWSEGRVGVPGGFLIFFNLLVISLGIGASWSRSRSLSLLPIIVFSIYLFTNSLGLTSGGRYIAPVDWIVYLFFMAGALQLVIFFLRAASISINEEPVEVQNEGLQLTKREIHKLFPVVMTILFIGSFLPASEMFYQPLYQVREPEDILTSLDKAGLLEQSGFSHDELVSFLSQPAAMIREGRMLYPRYYPAGDGEQDRSTYYRFLDYQRLVFTLIGPYSKGAEGVVIPGYPPPFSLHAEDVIVLGCWNKTYYAPFIDAVVVFVTTGDGYVYTRSPGAPLQCPLPEPNQ